MFVIDRSLICKMRWKRKEEFFSRTFASCPWGNFGNLTRLTSDRSCSRWLNWQEREKTNNKPIIGTIQLSFSPFSLILLWSIHIYLRSFVAPSLILQSTGRKNTKLRKSFSVLRISGKSISISCFLSTKCNEGKWWPSFQSRYLTTK